MKTSPKVTVLLPVYNRVSICNTIDSILAQTFTDFELLIIDNASTDDTVNVIKSYNDDRIVLYINEKNYGQTYSLNRGLSLAKGEYIARIDADDIAVPTRLEKQVAFLDANPDCGLVGGWVQYITEDNICTVTMRMPTTREGMCLLQRITCAMYHPVATMRKSVLEKNSIKYNADIKISEDYDMWRQIMLYSSALNLPEILCYYRKGDNDSVRYADILNKEALEIRKLIYCHDYKDSVLDYSLNILKLEEQEFKSLRTTLKIYKFFTKELKSNMDKKNVDYMIIKFYIMMHIYTFCIYYNKALYAKFIKKIYLVAKKIRYKVGNKKLSFNH